MKILLIEDDEIDVSYIQEILSEHDIEVQDDQKPFDPEKYDLVIADYYINGHSSFDLLHRMSKFSDLPVLVVSGKLKQIPFDDLPQKSNMLFLSKNENFRHLLTYYIGLITSPTQDKTSNETKVDYKTLFLNLVHDLRNDLNYATAYESVKEHFDDTEEELEFLRKIASSANYMYNRINTLSEYLDTDKEKVGTLKDAYDSIKDSGIIKDYKDSISLTGEVDTEIKQIPEYFLSAILKNLIENSCKNSPEKEELNIEVNYINSDDLHILKISDNAKGMSQEVADNLFNKKHNSHDGLGIGLVVLKRIIDSFNGKITVISEQGEGTTITIRF